jgi:hypothetical protein
MTRMHGDWTFRGTILRDKLQMPRGVRYHRDYPNGDPGPGHRARIARARQFIAIQSAVQRRYTAEELRELIDLFSKV